MRFTSLKQDHRLTLMLPHYHQLHRFTWVLPIDLFQLPEVNKFVHSAKALTPHLRVMFLVLHNEASFVTAKCRVAPLKELTLPRLELMAALIATRLTRFVLSSLPLHDAPIFMWSDSQIVLHWIKSETVASICSPPHH